MESVTPDTGAISAGALGAQIVTTALDTGDHAEMRAPRVLRARYQNVPPPGSSSVAVTGEPVIVATFSQTL